MLSGQWILVSMNWTVRLPRRSPARTPVTSYGQSSCDSVPEVASCLLKDKINFSGLITSIISAIDPGGQVQHDSTDSESIGWLVLYRSGQIVLEGFLTVSKRGYLVVNDQISVVGSPFFS
jgi:hypothetical protein